MPYFVWALLLVLANGAAWLSNLFTLPGNWILVALTALFAWLHPSAPGVHGVSWITVGTLVALAVAGEVIEFLAGAAGAAKRGGSRRGMVLAAIGAIVGSITGALVTLPIPLAPLVGALAGGAAGAFAGAYLGETWKGRAHGESFEIGKAALLGRLLGTAGKVAVGAIMWTVAAIDAFFRFGGVDAVP